MLQVRGQSPAASTPVAIVVTVVTWPA